MSVLFKLISNLCCHLLRSKIVLTESLSSLVGGTGVTGTPGRESRSPPGPAKSIVYLFILIFMFVDK
jgi:hypothetical protein